MSQEEIVQYSTGKLAVMSFNFKILLCNFPLNGFTAKTYHLVCSLDLRVPRTRIIIIVGGRE